MQVLVTGGTGDLGHRVVDRLGAAGHQPTVASRRPDQPGFVAYDLDEPPPLEGYDVVVHLASDQLKPERDTQALDRLLTSAEAAELPHLVFISIVGIDGHPLPYYRAKVEQERAIESGGVPWTILRATQFHSFIPKVALMLRQGPLTVVPRGYRMQTIDADAVADRLVHLVGTGPSGRARDIGGPEVIDVADALEEWARESGGKLRVTRMPLPGSLGRAFKEGKNLLGPDGEVIGSSYRAFVDDGR